MEKATTPWGRGYNIHPFPSLACNGLSLLRCIHLSNVLVKVIFCNHYSEHPFVCGLPLPCLFLLCLTRVVFSVVLHRLQSLCYLCLRPVRRHQKFNLSVLGPSRKMFECCLMQGWATFLSFVVCLTQLCVSEDMTFLGAATVEEYVVLYSSFL